MGMMIVCTGFRKFFVNVGFVLERRETSVAVTAGQAFSEMKDAEAMS